MEEQPGGGRTREGTEQNGQCVKESQPQTSGAMVLNKNNEKKKVLQSYN